MLSAALGAERRWPGRAVRSTAAVLATLVTALGMASCAPEPGNDVVRVPQDAESITAAVDEVAPGGLVLVEPGVYRESVTISTPDVTLRGTDRNDVVIDGEGVRPSGVVATADGVTVQNLTVRAHTFYGVLVTGMPDGGTGSSYEPLDPDEFPPVQRFLVDHVTAANNGLYGIYAFDSQHGVIQNSYASGSSDSGFYVGQCEDCDILVRHNIAERNAVGFENANASDSVYVIENRWVGNRVGMTLLSSYQEAFAPQRSNLVAGNLIASNVSSDSPVQASGGFGIGIGISGGQDNVLRANRIVENARAGVVLTNAEDLAARGNRFVDNEFADNGLDLVDTSAERAPSADNCYSGAAGLRVRPDALADARCPELSASSSGVAADELPVQEVPAGTDFLDVPGPPAQPSLEDVSESPDEPLPDSIGPPDVETVEIPARNLLDATAAVS